MPQREVGDLPVASPDPVGDPQHHAHDDQGRSDDPQIAEVPLDDVLQQNTEDHDREGADDDEPAHPRVVLHNLGDQAAEFELMSLFEPVLAPQEADESHPAFSNLFVSASAVDASCMLFERRPRRQSEQGLRVVHFLAASDAEVADVRMHCDRAQVLPMRQISRQK